MCLSMGMRHGAFHMFACRLAVGVCSVSVGFSGGVIAFGQLRCCLKMMVRSSDVVRRCKMMVFARHVSFVVSHDDVFPNG